MILTMLCLTIMYIAYNGLKRSYKFEGAIIRINGYGNRIKLINISYKRSFVCYQGHNDLFYNTTGTCYIYNKQKRCLVVHPDKKQDIRGRIV